MVKKPLNLTIRLACFAVVLPLVACAPRTAPTGKLPSTPPTKQAPATTTPTQAAPAQPAPVVMPTPAVPAQPAPSGYSMVAPLIKERRVSFDKPVQVINPEKKYLAILVTSKGNITLELNAKAAPVAVNNFVFLALNNFYNGTRFHRVVDGFMAQGGDPNSTDVSLRSKWGTGHPGYKFAAERSNGLRFDSAGVLGMARSASYESQGSQFFITLAPADYISGEYTVFGKVIDGMDVLKKITINYTNNGPISGSDADLLSSVQIFSN